MIFLENHLFHTLWGTFETSHWGLLISQFSWKPALPWDHPRSSVSGGGVKIHQQVKAPSLTFHYGGALWGSICLLQQLCVWIEKWTCIQWVLMVTPGLRGAFGLPLIFCFLHSSLYCLLIWCWSRRTVILHWKESGFCKYVSVSI